MMPAANRSAIDTPPPATAENKIKLCEGGNSNATSEADTLLGSLRRVVGGPGERRPLHPEMLDGVDAAARRLGRNDLAAELRRLRELLPGGTERNPPRRR